MPSSCGGKRSAASMSSRVTLLMPVYSSLAVTSLTGISCSPSSLKRYPVVGAHAIAAELTSTMAADRPKPRQEGQSELTNSAQSIPWLIAAEDPQPVAYT